MLTQAGSNCKKFANQHYVLISIMVFMKLATVASAAEYVNVCQFIKPSAATLALATEEPTYWKDAKPILAKKCEPCHKSASAPEE